MAKKKKQRDSERNTRRSADRNTDTESVGFWSGLRDETRNSIVGLTFIILALILIFAAFNNGGYLGGKIYTAIHFLFGVGYYVAPLLLVLLGVNFFRAGGHNFTTPALVAGPFFLLSALGLLSLFDQVSGTVGLGGFVGYYIMTPMVFLFANMLAGLILAAVFVVAILILFDVPLHLGFMFSFLKYFKKDPQDDAYFEEVDDSEAIVEAVQPEPVKPEPVQDPEPEPERPVSTNASLIEKLTGKKQEAGVPFRFNSALHSEYVAPPLTLLAGDKGKPSFGDIKGNSNIIKRTFQNFGIHVEMDEVSVGPSITRYALKPAEGVRLSKITALQHDLELALATSPIRIEAPIPGKSLVGIEVPNTMKSMVGLGSLLSESVWGENPNPLFAPLGKGISGMASFMNIAKMPHILVAGATGSGKSVTMQTIITSLLYRNSPEQLRFIMVDPKRVELTMYNGIPHLLTPVIIEPKKAILTLKWAVKEMERRYEMLEQEKCRDIHSYHKNVLQPALEKFEKQKEKGALPEGAESELPELMPYIVVIIDELADLMQAYPRELESAIVSIAQKARAVGIHLMIATQRPSVNVITGLIKANVPARIALQVVSQIDSRTILDMSGAENLLGQGDMLFLSPEMPKPIRLQSAFISENEVKSVVKFLKDHYEGTLGGELNLSNNENNNAFFGIPDDVLSGGDGDDDEKYDEAKMEVIRSQKASVSYLQRKLGVGYSRAGKLMDMLEERGIVGPGDGAKPRQVLVRDDTAGFGHEKDELNAHH